MRFLYVISFLVLCGVIDKVTGKTARITGKQVDTKIYPKQRLLSTKTPITNGQNVTWHKSFGTDVLYFGGEVEFEMGGKVKTMELKWNDGLDICEERGDDSLADAAGQVLRATWLPKDRCPVEKGTYRLRNPFAPMDVTLPNVLNSRRYVFKLDVGFAKTQLVFSTTYEIEVL